MEYGEVPQQRQPSSKKKRINCLVCKYFKVTWEPENPRACEMFGFKGKELPSVTVERVTGKECPAFTPTGKHKH